MERTPTLAAILIVQDEEHNIEECLESLRFCDQIIVVDGGSSDHTVEIARAAGARVEVRPDWHGFGVQKQRALDLAETDWVLSIDADERVSPALAAEILSTIRSPAAAGYRINRLSMFLGRFMRHGGWFPDRVTRLARRDSCRFTDAPVHEEMLVQGLVADLRETLTHHSYRTIDDVLRKLRQYALASAEVRKRRGKRGGLSAALVRAAFAFTKAYFLQAGMLDGSRGFVAALFRAEETFWRYLAVGWEPGR